MIKFFIIYPQTNGSNRNIAPELICTLAAAALPGLARAGVAA
jgi:hypothetical protein